MSERIAIGRIRTSHGVQGYAKILSYSGEVEHFKRLEEVVLEKDGRQIRIEVEKVQLKGDVLLLKFSGVDSPEEVKKYSGWDILVGRENASTLAEDEFYYSDLVNCRVFLNGNKSGSVVSLIEGGAGLLLEIEKDDGERRIVPFQKEFIGNVDTETRSIEILMPEVLE